MGTIRLLWLVSLLLASCARLPTTSPRVDALAPPTDISTQPELPSGYLEKEGWSGQRHAVATANPLASQAGLQILKAGGNALDAAIAAQMVLALVEPQSSGLGGGAFLLYFDGHDVIAYDGRETAPSGVNERLFLTPAGTPMTFQAAVTGGRAVGVPGVIRMLELAHREHGKLPWATLFGPAITLARSGFPVSHRLHTLLANDATLRDDPAAARFFYSADGSPWQIGHVLQNPALAEVFERVATHGATAFYNGTLAEEIVAKVQQHPLNPGVLTRDDLARYAAKKRDPICFDIAALARRYEACGFPPPGSGAIAIGQILGILSHVTVGSAPPPHEAPDQHDHTAWPGLLHVDWLHAYIEAARLALADRAQFIADPEFVSPPRGGWLALLSEDYLVARARKIAPLRMPSVSPGKPGAAPSAFAPMPEQAEFGTSHISVIDADGNALAMTSTIEDQFGARQFVHGFLLNNELTDFSFAPADGAGKPIANRVEPGKRPRSSMSPTLVFEKNPDGSRGKFVMSLGSSGGEAIIHHAAKTLVGVLNWGLSPQQAINLPNFGTTANGALLEERRFPSPMTQALQARGHTVREAAMTSGLQALQKTSDGWQGGADPRREGTVAGQ